MNDEHVTAILGLVLNHLGGEVTIPYSEVHEGLPEDSKVAVEPNDEDEVLVVRIVSNEQS